jgi:hypothetical protein
VSVNFLRLIPTEPDWVPANCEASATIAVLRSFAPNSRAITTKTQDAVVFVDAGGNFESVLCPACDRRLEIGWWQEQMSAAFDTDFRNLEATTPCCDFRTTLNDLKYVWPQGFSRWMVEVESPRRGRLTAHEVCVVEQALGHAVRVIWTHI